MTESCNLPARVRVTMQLRDLLLAVLFCALLSACAPRPAATSTASPPAATVTTMAEPPTVMSSPPTDTATPPPTTPPTSVPPTTPAPVTPPTEVGATQTPGLLVSGYVQTRDGTGLAGVTICRNFASYNGMVVATTDATGFFRSDFAFIPGDEMVGVWAVAPGYNFDPPLYQWRHYYGLEERPLDFLASSGTPVAAPPVPCP